MFIKQIPRSNGILVFIPGSGATIIGEQELCEGDNADPCGTHPPGGTAPKLWLDMPDGEP